MNRFLNNYFPAMIWPMHHFLIKSWELNFLTLLLLARLFLITGCFLIREMPKVTAPLYQRLLSRFGTFVPVLMIWEPVESPWVIYGQILSIIGIVAFIFTILELGKSFGLAPALRTKVDSGIYRWINHPMYVSHIIFELGILISCPSIWNLAIVAISTVFFVLRAKWEKDLILARGNQNSALLA
jgi:hypothetical protein